MTTTKRHFERRHGTRHGSSAEAIELDDYRWPELPDYSYELEDELCDQLFKFPSPGQVDELCYALRGANLRSFSAGIASGGIEHVKNNTTRLEYAKLLNSWIATAEEIVAAGRNVNRIAARRTKKVLKD